MLSKIRGVFGGEMDSVDSTLDMAKVGSDVLGERDRSTAGLEERGGGLPAFNSFITSGELLRRSNKRLGRGKNLPAISIKDRL